MIVIGYPGIGKTTLARKNNRYIDLCSEDFFYEGTRPKGWFVIYCKIAERLSKQGYIVFVSSHEPVRLWLMANSKEKKVVVYPSTELKTQWLEKLKKRADLGKSDKDARAYDRAKGHYLDDVSALAMCGIKRIEIGDMNYCLEALLKESIEAIWV